MQPYKISERGLLLIMKFEGFSASTYNDAAGHPTIGYGHKIRAGEKLGNSISQAEAEALLQIDIVNAQRAVERLVKVGLTQPQYDALVSLIYNVGETAFSSSTLLKKLNKGIYTEAAKEFVRWNKIRKAGVLMECAGLTARRATESRLFQEI